MKKLKIRVEDIDIKSPYLIHHADFFIELLKKYYSVEILKDKITEPDILFFSCWGGMDNVKWPNCIRIYYTAERDCPDFNMCDYAIGLVNIGETERFLHFPFYTFYNNLLPKYEALNEIKDFSPYLNRGFCSTVVTDPYRDHIFFDFFEKLNKYKPIASGGKWNNNVGGPVPDKLDFIKKYKFHLAFENMKVDDYVTEKIMEPLVAQTIPIYWGSKTVKKEFGEGSYIDISDFTSIEEAIEFIIKVDNDDELYMKILNTRAQLPLSYKQWCEKVENFLLNIIENGSRIFNPRCNRVYAQKNIYHIIHESLLGKIYRMFQKLKYKLMY